EGDAVDRHPVVADQDAGHRVTAVRLNFALDRQVVLAHERYRPEHHRPTLVRDPAGDVAPRRVTPPGAEANHHDAIPPPNRFPASHAPPPPTLSPRGRSHHFLVALLVQNPKGAPVPQGPGRARGAPQRGLDVGLDLGKFFLRGHGVTPGMV